MGSVVVNFTFNTDAQSWTYIPTTTSSSTGSYAGSGNPPGCLDINTGGQEVGTTGIFISPDGTTFQSFGVPSGVTVTGFRILTMDNHWDFHYDPAAGSNKTASMTFELIETLSIDPATGNYYSSGYNYIGGDIATDAWTPFSSFFVGRSLFLYGSTMHAPVDSSRALRFAFELFVNYPTGTGGNDHFRVDNISVELFWDDSTGGTVTKTTGVELLCTRTAYLLVSNASHVPAVVPTGLICQHAHRSNLSFDALVTVDMDTTATAPCLNSVPELGLVSCLYRANLTEGSGTDTWRIYRKISMDDGLTWISDPINGDGTRKELLSNVKNCREVYNRRTREWVRAYNDNSGTSGAGLLQVDIYDIAGVKVGTFPTGGAGILGWTVSDDSFSLLQLPDGGGLRVTVNDSGTFVSAQSEDDGRTWFEVTTM